jgi:2-phospho-L-lactate guanylyltransferase
LQGTIKHYDSSTRTGSILTDDRVEIRIDERSTSQEDLRALRVGQRVRFEVTGDGGERVARSLSLVTF